MPISNLSCDKPIGFFSLKVIVHGILQRQSYTTKQTCLNTEFLLLRKLKAHLLDTILNTLPTEVFIVDISSLNSNTCIWLLVCFRDCVPIINLIFSVSANWGASALAWK